MKGMESWKKRRREQCESDLEYFDVLVPYYRMVMEALSTQQRKVMCGIMDAGIEGISPSALSGKVNLSLNTVTSVAGRLADKGLISRESIQRDKRGSVYKCVDGDLISVRVMRSPEFEDYHNRHRNDDNPLGDYMSLMSSQKTPDRDRSELEFLRDEIAEYLDQYREGIDTVQAMQAAHDILHSCKQAGLRKFAPARKEREK